MSQHSSGEYVIAEILEGLANARMVIEFTTLIETDIFLFESISRGVFLEKRKNPIDGGALADADFAMEMTGESVTTEDITCLTIETYRSSWQSL
jgi:hypothetical protein